MRPGKILVALTLLFSFSASAKTVEGSVRKKFDASISELKTKLKNAKADKWKVLSETENQIQNLRKQNAVQPDADEVYMDMVFYSLKQIPRNKEFKVSECPDYRTHILAAFDPHGEEKPTPAIAQTLSVLDLLCQK